MLEYRPHYVLYQSLSCDARDVLLLFFLEHEESNTPEQYASPFLLMLLQEPEKVCK
jgi:hypothetical protein